MLFHVPPGSARFVSRAILFLIALGGTAVTVDAQSPPGPAKLGVRVLRDLEYAWAGDKQLLLVHGDQDATVPYHQAQLLFEALQRVRVPVHLHTVTGGGHGLGSREANERVAEFFAQHLQGVAAAPAFASANSSSPGRNDLPTAARPPLPRGLTWERVREREDRNQDGKVTADEFGGPPTLFQQLDRNRDGELTASDFESRGAR